MRRVLILYTGLILFLLSLTVVGCLRLFCSETLIEGAVRFFRCLVINQRRRNTGEKEALLSFKLQLN